MQLIRSKFQPYLFIPMIVFFRESWRIALWLVIAGVAMTIIISSGQDWSASILIKVASFTCLIWLSLWLGNAYLSQWIDTRISWQENPGFRLVVGIVAMLIYTIASVYALVWFYRWAFNFNVSDDMRGFLYSSIIITTIISMFMTSRSFLLNWRQSAIDAETSKRESIKAHYESLKSQVNPHFLFNSLNALSNLVYEDQEKAVKFIKQLSEVYRYVLDSRGKEVVPLEEEVHFLKSYLYLQQIRFGNKLKVEMNLGDLKGTVAPLALQMLVENAIKHNVISEDDPLTIHITREGKNLVVENSLNRKNVLPEESNGLGLENIKRRYSFLTDNPVVVKESEKLFSVVLPVLSAL
ncbi:MAG: sensor histidine kinase [Cyclobacteriaceae bacterium]|nr:sensor histidine kinase [Cyclobacteriaceae bacterium]